MKRKNKMANYKFITGGMDINSAVMAILSPRTRETMRSGRYTRSVLRAFSVARSYEEKGR